MFSKRDGKKIRKTFPSKGAAESWRNDASTKVRDRTLRAPTSVILTQAADAWLEGARSGLIRTRSGDPYKPAALRAYESAWRLRVCPKLGSRKVADIGREDLQDLVNELISDGLSPSTIVVTMLPVRGIYRRALRRGEVAVNPTTGLEMPAVRNRRERTADAVEGRKLLGVLAAGDRAIWATAMYAGLRRGELRALRTGDIDLKGGVLRVSRGWDLLEGEITPKSGKSRVVPIASGLRAILAEHLLGLAWGEGLAFGMTSSKPFDGTPLVERADKAWSAAKLQRITLHECRHTFASLMIEAGVNAKALSEYMGHAKISTTMDLYGHLMPGNEKEAAGLLDAYLARTEEHAG